MVWDRMTIFSLETLLSSNISRKLLYILSGEERARPHRPPERVRRRPRPMRTRMMVTMTTTDESADDGVETGSEGDYVPGNHEFGVSFTLPCTESDIL